MKKGLLILLYLATLPFSLSARQTALRSETLLDELRLELSDIKHELHSTRIEMNLLEEKIAKQERIKNTHQDAPAALSQIHVLEKKIDKFEKLLDKILADLRSVSGQANKALSKLQVLENTLAAQEQKYDDIAKLKTTLSSLSQAITEQTLPTKSYRVKAGDSLEKIARAHHTTVEAIKQLNHLSQDKIVIGQELKLSDEYK